MIRHPKDVAFDEGTAPQLFFEHQFVVTLDAEGLLPGVDAEGGPDAFAVVGVNLDGDVIFFLFDQSGVGLEFVEFVKLLEVAFVILQLVTFQQAVDVVTIDGRYSVEAAFFG